MKLNDIDRVHHIYDMARKAIEVCNSQTKKEFLENETLSMAFIYILPIICEAASGITQEFRESHSNIEWKK